ncbi:CREB-regulated transcription coactivator 1 isoform X5 [Diorhabda carinulata]|uniref:CREB-regulated transcription coactivator 1 isoform X2 n=1 Tax=Diorhabda sublineata TaxID=1163346 RepID=UPI0024E14EAE|nr:CREB-regulated transcription coactivator 1 isoform X2 [Diorhabda sublineata]XP_057664224.1 CREB-regulated transcription coactivator 1 isoform X5 [Diorhabda carinulata]
MANPRKFSEKIALHNHREAEETAAFEKIMREVKEVKGKDESCRSRKMPGNRVEVRGRTLSQSGPMRKPHERRLDTSPYYLSPPTDTGWRRTNSDSALHQSTMQGLDRNNDCSNRCWPIQMMNGPDRRPKSSCDIPSQSRVPGISIHPSTHDPNLGQMPIANTGSLPDLTNVDFSSPIHPLDQDHDSSQYSSSPLNTSPLNTSPSTLSPTSIPLNARPQNRFHFTNSHPNIQLDKNLVNMVDNSNYAQLPGLSGIYQQQCPSTSPSPTLQQTGAYRSPRPSPQSSPSPGRHSAPCSPGATSPLPNEYHVINQPTSQFQQHFEQLSMLDPPTSMSYVDQSTGAQHQPHSPSNIQNASPIGSIEMMTTDAGYYSTSPQQLVYPSPSPGLRTTPNTPTSLPEIVLTDFSGDDGRTDIFDESLKEGLGTLDFDEFQMLTNSSIGISEIVEDHFRLDHRS